eukprot:Rmarinus@m.3500
MDELGPLPLSESWESYADVGVYPSNRVRLMYRHDSAEKDVSSEKMKQKHHIVVGNSSMHGPVSSARGSKLIPKKRNLKPTLGKMCTPKAVHPRQQTRSTNNHELRQGHSSNSPSIHGLPDGDHVYCQEVSGAVHARKSVNRVERQERENHSRRDEMGNGDIKTVPEAKRAISRILQYYRQNTKLTDRMLRDTVEISSGHDSPHHSHKPNPQSPVHESSPCYSPAHTSPSEDLGKYAGHVSQVPPHPVSPPSHQNRVSRRHSRVRFSIDEGNVYVPKESMTSQKLQAKGSAGFRRDSHCIACDGSAQSHLHHQTHESPPCACRRETSNIQSPQTTSPQPPNPSAEDVAASRRQKEAERRLQRAIHVRRLRRERPTGLPAWDRSDWENKGFEDPNSFSLERRLRMFVMKRAVRVIERTWQTCIHTRAVMKIQPNVRSWLAKRDLHRRKLAARVLQRSLRCYVWRLRLRVWWRRVLRVNEDALILEPISRLCRMFRRWFDYRALRLDARRRMRDRFFALTILTAHVPLMERTLEDLPSVFSREGSVGMTAFYRKRRTLCTVFLRWWRLAVGVGGIPRSPSPIHEPHTTATNTCTIQETTKTARTQGTTITSPSPGEGLGFEPGAPLSSSLTSAAMSASALASFAARSASVLESLATKH